MTSSIFHSNHHQLQITTRDYSQCAQISESPCFIQTKSDTNPLSYRASWTEPTSSTFRNSRPPLNYAKDETAPLIFKVALSHQQDIEFAPTQPSISIKSLPIVLICQGLSVKLNYIIQQFLMPHITMIHFLNSWYHWAFRGRAKYLSFIEKDFSNTVQN